MFALLVLCVGGILAGFLLLRFVPLVPAQPGTAPKLLSVSVVIPARNEEKNLPVLLASLSADAIVPFELLVVDDGSTDQTAAIAFEYGATVITSASLPEGWTGKTWACHQGALAASGEVFFFLDADTWFVPGGYARIVNYFATLPQNTAFSILPFHITRCRYESLSLFFNILVAMGAGGFGKLDAPHLFGQSLMIRKDMYAKAGGHAAVKQHVLENLHFAECVKRSGGNNIALGGRGTLEMRMFPHGLEQLRESWQKAFATGAGQTSPLVLWLSVYWLACGVLAPFMLIGLSGGLWPIAIGIYLVNVAQVAWYGSQLGTLPWATPLLYPIPLIFYFATFGQSFWRQKRKQPATWRGREVW